MGEFRGIEQGSFSVRWLYAREKSVIFRVRETSWDYLLYLILVIKFVKERERKFLKTVCSKVLNFDEYFSFFLQEFSCRV